MLIGLWRATLCCKVLFLISHGGVPTGMPSSHLFYTVAVSFIAFVFAGVDAKATMLLVKS